MYGYVWLCNISVSRRDSSTGRFTQNNFPSRKACDVLQFQGFLRGLQSPDLSQRDEVRKNQWVTEMEL